MKNGAVGKEVGNCGVECEPLARQVSTRFSDGRLLLGGVTTGVDDGRDKERGVDDVEEGVEDGVSTGDE